MSPIFIFINGCLFASAVFFLIRRFRTRRRRGNQVRARKDLRRAAGETPFRKAIGKTDLVLYSPPAHFDGRRYRTERALSRESILFSITRNHTLAVKKPRDEE